ncbi:hypothetical protein BOKEGFJH_00224 [Chlamydia avium]|nr:hypothetical protein BOKEGFJH_00224 [Chlamydia avium]
MHSSSVSRSPVPPSSDDRVVSSQSSLKLGSRLATISLIVLSILGALVLTGLLIAGVVSLPIGASLLTLTLVFAGVFAATHCFLSKKRLPQVKKTLESLEPSSPLEPSLPKTPTTTEELPLFPSSMDNYQSMLEAYTSPLPDAQSIQIGKVEPKATTLTHNVWNITKTRTYLVSVVGDIADPRFNTNLSNLMLVNAANARMSRGGGGTNRAFTSAVSTRGWANSTEGKILLEPGECTVGQWENPDGTINSEKSSLPRYLVQMLGPNAADCDNNIDMCEQLVFRAYSSCFEKGMSLRSQYIQLPLISSLNYAPPPGTIVRGKDIHELWIGTVKSAFVKAVITFALKNPEYSLVIVMVNRGSPIL